MSVLRRLSKRLGKLDRGRSEPHGSGDAALLLRWVSCPVSATTPPSGGVV